MLVAKPEEKAQFWKHRRRWENKAKMDLQKCNVRVWMNSSGSG